LLHDTRGHRGFQESQQNVDRRRSKWSHSTIVFVIVARKEGMVVIDMPAPNRYLALFSDDVAAHVAPDWLTQ
jgi:hypothetical protein